MTEVAAQALFADPGHVHEDDDEDRERGGEVDVRRGGREVLGRVAGRDQLKPVGDEDEGEQGERERNHGPAGLAHGGCHLLVDGVEDRLDGELELAGHAGGRLRPQVEADPEDDGPRDERREHGVHVDRLSEDPPRDVGADGDRRDDAATHGATPVVPCWRSDRIRLTT